MRQIVGGWLIVGPIWNTWSIIAKCFLNNVFYQRIGHPCRRRRCRRDAVWHLNDFRKSDGAEYMVSNDPRWNELLYWIVNHLNTSDVLKILFISPTTTGEQQIKLESFSHDPYKLRKGGIIINEITIYLRPSIIDVINARKFTHRF